MLFTSEQQTKRSFKGQYLSISTYRPTNFSMQLFFLLHTIQYVNKISDISLSDR